MYLLQYEVKPNEVGKTYHELFHILSKKSGCIVLGVYRYEDIGIPSRSAPKMRSSVTEGKLSHLSKEKNHDEDKIDKSGKITCEFY